MMVNIWGKMILQDIVLMLAIATIKSNNCGDEYLQS